MNELFISDDQTTLTLPLEILARITLETTLIERHQENAFIAEHSLFETDL